MLLRDLNRLDRRREPENNDNDDDDGAAEEEARRQRLQRVLSRLSRLQQNRPSYGPPPAQQQSLYDWAPTNEAPDDADQAAARRRQFYRRHERDLRSAAIMHNARTSLPSPSAMLQQNDDEDARTALRRSYLAENPSQDAASPSAPSRPSAQLESAVQYLDRVRDCSSYDESLGIALDHALFAPEYYDDLFTTDPYSPPHTRPQPSSWLSPGAVFRGTQHTTTPSKDASSSLQSPPTFDATRPWLSHTPTTPFPNLPAREIQDRWPVKVTIQAIDHQNMTMAGTMEAFDVPNTPCSSAEPCTPAAPITTYLEGQIIDLNIHTFLTPTSPPTPQAITFPPTSAVVDAAYWRNLPPFSSMGSDQEVARVLLSRSLMNTIMSQWVFMRWKERCFIHSKSDPCHRHTGHSTAGHVGQGDDTDTGHGLTISGFYYVSLRRDDGNIDGLYFDTKTSPYQHLKLEAKNGGAFGAWQFK